MHVLTEKMRAPEFKVDAWLNLSENHLPEPLSMAALKGRVVLIDFWDYTCINCLHTLPYLQEWHRRYQRDGLVVIGLHAPEFTFAKNSTLIEEAVRQLNLPYTIGIDNEFRTWNSYANRAWPAKYLIDAAGYVRAFHYGEGAYQEFEHEIQRCLLELKPDLKLPKLMAPVRPMDEPGAVCTRPTPELYLGYGRGEVGNPEGNPPDRVIHYPAESLQQRLDTLYLEGHWLNAKEAVETACELPARIHVNYRAAEVNLVMNPTQGSVTLHLSQDGHALPPDHAGEDVSFYTGEATVTVDRPGIYRLVKNPDFEHHRLSLMVQSPGLQAYAFTFISCVSTDTLLA